jgi:hypothetical protein
MHPQAEKVRTDKGVNMPIPTGARLNAEWDIDVVHSLFSKTGTWFNRLERFPGALCDPFGFVRFETEAEYLNCSAIRVGKRTNVTGGIGRLRRYVRAR